MIKTRKSAGESQDAKHMSDVLSSATYRECLKNDVLVTRDNNSDIVADLVSQYYDAHSMAEDNRLKNNPEEFEVTLAAVAEYCHPGSKVLDIGGGTGIYSVELCKMGCDVLLADISEKCLMLAKNNAASAGVIINTMVANAMDHTIDLGEAYDLILCLGPLYHCANVIQAENVILNVMERLRSGGVAIFAFLSRYSKFNDMYSSIADCADSDIESLEEYMSLRTSSDGDWSFEKRGELPISFVFPENIEHLFRRVDLVPKEVFAVDAFHNLNINRNNAKRILNVVRGSSRKLCLQRGNHILVIVHKGDTI